MLLPQQIIHSWCCRRGGRHGWEGRSPRLGKTEYFSAQFANNPKISSVLEIKCWKIGCLKHAFTNSLYIGQAELTTRRNLRALWMDPCFAVFFRVYPNEASTQIEIISPFFGLTLKTYDITDNLDVLHGLKTSDNIFIVTSLFMDAFLLLYWNPQKRW